MYFPRRVIPMLPEKLSNGLCSLNPEQDRLAMVCDMVIDGEGAIDAYQFYPAVICSHARLTYTEVAAVLANTRGPEAQQRADLVPHLLHLHEVYRALLKQRAKRGAIDFETTETQIVCDDNGRIEKIVPRTRNEAHRLIEEAMLAANVCAADFIAAAEHPALYRVHEGPTPEKRVTLQNYLRALGIGLAPERRSDAGRDPGHRAGHQGPARRDADPHHAAALDAAGDLHRANAGHFGLAYDAYTHFTSPIRRYPDLLVHRVIKAILGGKRYHLDAALVARMPPAPPRRGAASRRGQAAQGDEQELETWEAAGAHCSANERRADEASRDVEAWLKCRFMRDHLGEEYAGTVSARHQLRPVRHARRAVCRRPGAHHRTGRRVLPLRRGAPGTARRTHRRALCGGHARARAGQPRRPGRPQASISAWCATASRAAADARRAARRARAALNAVDELASVAGGRPRRQGGGAAQAGKKHGSVGGRPQPRRRARTRDRKTPTRTRR